MPPKIKITKENIIKTAIKLCQSNGASAISARSIAEALNCSTQPIFSNFATMEELQGAVIAYAYELYWEFIKKEIESGRYPEYKSFGMAYIRFAKDEKELFKLLFMRERSKSEMTAGGDFDASVEIIMKSNGISKEKAILLHLEMWACVHGIATMIATSFYTLQWELIEKMLTDIYQGTRRVHTEKEI